MKPIKTFSIGSVAFFSNFSDFTPKDRDELCIMDEFIFEGRNVLHCSNIKGKDIFFYRNMDKEGFIRDALKDNLPMKLGKFLVPEFAEHLGMTINDLKQLQNLADRMDEKHQYEKIIYDAYLENDKFELTETQLQNAYQNYKTKRNLNK